MTTFSYKYFFLFPILLFNCSTILFQKDNNPSLVLLEKIQDKAAYKILPSNFETFFLGINPIEYHKDRNTMSLNGILDYPPKVIYSQKYDTIYKGISNAFIYIATKKNNELLLSDTLGSTNCNGRFNVSFKMKDSVYLVFDVTSLPVTGFYIKEYFKNYKKNYKSTIVEKNPCR